MSPGFEKHPRGPGNRGLVPGEGWADDGWSRFREAVSWEIDLSPPPPPSYSPLFTTECLIVLAGGPLLFWPLPWPPLGPTHHLLPSTHLPLGSSNQITLMTISRRKCYPQPSKKRRQGDQESPRKSKLAVHIACHKPPVIVLACDTL